MQLSDITSMRVGGAAERFVRPTTRDELVAEVLEAWSDGSAWLVIGGGTNLVVADDGIEGTVIQVATAGVERLADDVLRIEAGHSWDDVVAYAVREGLAGIEALSGIPGSSGAAPVQNIGAYGQELADTLIAIDFLDYLTSAVIRLSAEELGLGYRSSALKAGREGVVLGIELQLAASVRGTIGYPQLASALSLDVGDTAPLGVIRDRVLGLRASKGMVLDAADPDSVGCGSFFTNPIVSEAFAQRLPADAPRWSTASEGADAVVPLGAAPAAPPEPTDAQVKLSAAWLIERSGIARGFRLPGSRVAISSKHSLAITNRGGGTAGEVAELSRYIRARVLADFGIDLQPEPVAVGVQL